MIRYEYIERDYINVYGNKLILTDFAKITYITMLKIADFNKFWDKKRTPKNDYIVVGMVLFASAIKRVAKKSAAGTRGIECEGGRCPPDGYCSFSR